MRCGTPKDGILPDLKFSKAQADELRKVKILIFSLARKKSRTIERIVSNIKRKTNYSKILGNFLTLLVFAYFCNKWRHTLTFAMAILNAYGTGII